jgi:hypothetical protein
MLRDLVPFARCDRWTHRAVSNDVALIHTFTEAMVKEGATRPYSASSADARPSLAGIREQINKVREAYPTGLCAVGDHHR